MSKWIKHRVGDRVQIFPGGKFSKKFEYLEGVIVDKEVSDYSGRVSYEVETDLGSVLVKGKYLMPLDDEERLEIVKSWRDREENKRWARKQALEDLKLLHPEIWEELLYRRKTKRLLRGAEDKYPGLAKLAAVLGLSYEDLEKFLEEEEENE